MRRTALFAAAVIAIALAGAYGFIRWEGSSARTPAPALERFAAAWLLHQAVPGRFRTMANPLARPFDSANALAGERLFRAKCQLCHGYDGSGRTEIGAGQYPRPPDLRSTVVQSASDGEIFYHIANGIRHTGMPAWSLPERQVWQLVLYLRQLPAAAPSRVAGSGVSPAAQFVGSGTCGQCHAEIYRRWRETRMANVVRDPRTHPEAIAPDLNRPDPLVSFRREDIAFVYGSKWRQRYFKRVGDDFFPLPAQWDFTHGRWRAYHVEPGTDWWAQYYPGDNSTRPTGPLCDGCHSVNYDVRTKTVTEWNVGCERCHGPGSEHVRSPRSGGIINPARLDYVHANDVCISCHSQGRPLSNPIGGKYYDWPVGYEVGNNLADVWQLEEHRPGRVSFTHFADGTAHKNRMQGNDFVQSLMYTRGITCFSCHDPHGTPNEALLRRPGGQVCLGCHGPDSPNGPHAVSIEAHTHHRADTAGSDCVSCHMPKIQQTIADVNVHAHTFRFITPAQTAQLGVPNPCALCHADRSAEWIGSALRSWPERSPWRMME